MKWEAERKADLSTALLHPGSQTTPCDSIREYEHHCYFSFCVSMSLGKLSTSLKLPSCSFKSICTGDCVTELYLQEPKCAEFAIQRVLRFRALLLLIVFKHVLSSNFTKMLVGFSENIFCGNFSLETLLSSNDLLPELIFWGWSFALEEVVMKA